MTTPPHLHLEASQVGARTVLTVRGEIDLASAPLLEDRIGTLAGDAIVDLSAVDFIDSTGLRVLIAADEQRGGLPLVVVDGPVARLFDITGVAERLHVFGTLAAALDA